jgi:hypothetical protein
MIWQCIAANHWLLALRVLYLGTPILDSGEPDFDVKDQVYISPRACKHNK